MGDSLRSTPVTNVAYLTLNGNFGNNNNDAQLVFRPLNKELAPVSGNYYSLATNQTTDPSLRINRWSATGQLIDYGFLYDSRFNKPPSSRTVVAGGLYNATNLLYSLDNGFLWLPSASGSALLSVCRTAAFNGSLWVAGGEGPTAGGQLLYSGDGITWNVSPNARPLLVDTSDVGTVLGVAANESLWVAGCGRPNSVLYSYDGIYWATSTTASALLSECHSVAWNGSLWVATGVGITGFGSTNIIYSYDGIVWYPSVSTGNPFYVGLSIAWNGSLWIIGGYKVTDLTVNTLASSFDGINWTYYTSPLDIVHAVAYNGGLWIIGGEYFDGNTGATLFTSPDGTTWTPVLDSDTFLGICYSLAWTGTVWLAGGAKGIARSFDGSNWLIANTESYFSPNGCAALAVNNVLPNAPLSTTPPPSLLLGGDSGIAYSSDGITWESIRSSLDLSGATCNALLWNGSLWLGGFRNISNTIGYSYDGLNWNISPNGSLALLDGCYAFATDGRITLAGGEGSNRMIYSSNGRDWVTIPSADSLFNNNICRTIGYNGAQWIAGSTSSNNRLIYTSDPSGTWNASTSGNELFINVCLSVAWNGSIWVAVGDTIAFSSNGIDWTEAATIPPPVYLWTTVAYNGSLWVAGNRAPIPIAYSYDGNIWRAATVPTSVDQCQSVTWTGSLWIAATGISPDNTVSAAYSYNGITWFASPDSKSVISNGNAVAAKRLNPTAGVYLPPPVLNPVPATQPGQVVYSTGLNNLYVSSIFNVNDASGQVQIQGDLSASTVHADIFYGSTTIITNDLSANTIQVGTLTGSNATIEDISASIINVWTDLSANTVYANTLFANTFEPARLNVGDISANRITVTDISAVNLDAENLYVTGIIAPIITAETLNAGIILGTTGSLPIGTLANESAITITDDRTTIKNVDLLGPVYISHEAGVGQLVLDSSGSLEYPESQIYTNATDSSSGQLILSPNPYNYGIVLTPTQTQIQNNPRIVGSGLLIDNGAIGKTGSTPNSIVIGDTRTMVQNADLSGNVFIGDGQLNGNLFLQGGTLEYPTCLICPNAIDNSGELVLRGNATSSTGIVITPAETQINNARIRTSGLLIDNGAIGNQPENPNAIVISNTTMIQNADLSGTVRIGQGIEYGQAQIQVVGTADNPASFIYSIASDSSGQLNLGGNPGSIGISLLPGDTQLSNAHVIGSSLRIDNGTIGINSAVNPNAIVIGDTRTMVQNADLSGTVLIGNLSSGALQLTSSSSVSTIRPTVASAGRLTIGSSVANPNAIVISDTSGMIIQNRGDLSGTITIGNLSRGLRITGGDVSGTIQSFNTIRPTVSASGEILIGSSTANQNAIRITDSATTLKNVSFLGGLLLGNNGTIGSTTSNVNAIVVTDTSGTIFQNRGDSSGTIFIGNPVNPTLGRGALRITGGDISGVAYPSFATIRPSVSVSGCLVLGSSTINPDAITITDTTTSIKNLSFSGGLFLGNNGTIGATRDGSNATAITVSDTSGTIIQYLSPRSYKLPDFASVQPGFISNTFNTVLPGPGIYNIWSVWDTLGTINTITTNSLNIPGRYVLAMQTPNYTAFVPPSGRTYRRDATMDIVTDYPQGTQNTLSVLLEPTYFYSFDLVAVTNVDSSNNSNSGSGPFIPPVPELTGFMITNWQVSSSLSQAIYPLCTSGGTTTLGSSQANPSAITITDTATTISRASLASATITNSTLSGSFNGSVTSSAVTSSTNQLTLGSSGNTSGITITDTITRITNLASSSAIINLGELVTGATLPISGPGQYYFQTDTLLLNVDVELTVDITTAGRYSFTCTGTRIPTRNYSTFLTVRLLQKGSYATSFRTVDMRAISNYLLYSFDVISLPPANCVYIPTTSLSSNILTPF